MEKEHFSKNNQRNENNISCGGINIHIGELQYDSLMLKDIDVAAHLNVTDNNIVVQSDATMRLISLLLGKFGDSLNNAIVLANKKTEQRISDDTKYYEAKTSREEAQTKMYQAQARKYEAEADKLKSHTDDK